MTAEKAHQLLDPADKQNVPKAVNLLQCLLKLQDGAPIPSLPPKVLRRRATSFFSEVLGYFLRPFITIDMTLSEQIRSLVTYAHLIAAMWRQHGTRFITGALYADSQAVVKNIVLCVARLQLVDNDLSFYIILEGTDRLEGLFGDCRTQDHSWNFDVQQLSEKLATSSLIQGIFERNPDLDQGHRRLALKDALGIDHVNPHSWSGDVRVGSVELAAEWAHARRDANRHLERYFGASARVNFDDLFREDNIDLLRPNGAYVGSDYQHDDARTEDPEEQSVLDRADPEVAPHSPPHPPPIPHPVDTTEDRGDDDEVCDDEPEGMGLEDFLPGCQTTGTTHDTDKMFLTVDGHCYHKSSIVTSILTAKRSRKVTMRTLRARGVTIEDLHGSDQMRLNSSDLTGDNLVKSGDVAAILVRIGGLVCLAVIEIVEFVVKETDRAASKLSAVELTKLEKPEIGIKALVQVLRLERQAETAASTEWLWTHQYSSVNSASTSSAVRARHTLEVPGHLLYPLAPTVITTTPETDATSSVPVARTRDVTWEFNHEQLEEALDAAWHALSPDTDDIVVNLDGLPMVKGLEGLPYTDHGGMCVKVQILIHTTHIMH